jgi:hypothetical protein
VAATFFRVVADGCVSWHRGVCPRTSGSVAVTCRTVVGGGDTGRAVRLNP